MTSPLITPVLLNDAELLQIAVAPRSPLFPTLNRASAFAPLIMVCCVLPAMQLLAYPTPNEEVSMWGLRSLAVANSSNLAEFLQPGLNEPGQPLIDQPPLSAWLNGTVVRILGPSHPLATSTVSLVATGIAIWLATRMAWRFGGANTALVSALLMCSHPQVLEMAISPSSGALGFWLMLASVFGFQRHLERSSSQVSSSLILSGVTWGLSLLAIGPVAFSVPVLFAMHAMNQRTGVLPERESRSFQNWLARGWPVQRSTLILVVAGFIIGGWWEMFMLWTRGSAFWRSWWTALPLECLSRGTEEWRCDLRPLIQPTLLTWLNQQALLIGWLIVGLERSWHELRLPTNESSRRRFQLLLLWWCLAFVARILAEIASTFFVTNTLVWNIALLAPTILLAALGIGTLIERAVSRRGEFCLVVLLVTLTVFQITMSWLMGMTGGAIAATVLICGPRLISSTGRNENGWSENNWRQLLRVTVYGSLFACISLGFVSRSARFGDDARLADLRDRLKGFPNVRRISLIATGDPIPITLRYLLRCRWPQAEIVTCEGWDSGLTRAMNEESAEPRSQFLILEWTRREVRFSVDTGHGWQMKSVGDPMRLHGRRLSLILIGPQA